MVDRSCKLVPGSRSLGRERGQWVIRSHIRLDGSALSPDLNFSLFSAMPRLHKNGA